MTRCPRCAEIAPCSRCAPTPPAAGGWPASLLTAAVLALFIFVLPAVFGGLL